MNRKIVTQRNLYPGINPHLNSLLQTSGNMEQLSKWPSFHASHISDIANALNVVLPPSYTARAEQSLQVLAADTIETQIKRPRPDITVYGEPFGNDLSANLMVAEPLVFALDETIHLDEDFVTAVMIRDMRDDSELGKAVVRIELLSPSNKPGHVGYEHYNRVRTDALFTGIPLIELDYLHEAPPPMGKVPIYPKQRDSHPYHIFVNEPRPSVKEGQMLDYWFDVDSAFPKVVIPLADEDYLEFSFGIAYDFTYISGRWGSWRNLVDYSQLPVRFHTYSPADQERIQARMAAIGEAHGRSDNLETYQP